MLECKQSQYSNCSHSRANDSGGFSPISPITEPIKLTVIYILTKFDDWLLIVDATLSTNKM